MQHVRVDTAGVGLLAGRWGTSVGELKAGVAPSGLGLSCQASSAGVNAAHAEVIAFAAALATRVDVRAAHVASGDGTLNETVCGLLALPEDKRPVLGYIPTGTTNDSTPTFGFSANEAGSANELAAVAYQ